MVMEEIIVSEPLLIDKRDEKWYQRRFYISKERIKT